MNNGHQPTGEGLQLRAILLLLYGAKLWRRRQRTSCPA